MDVKYAVRPMELGDIPQVAEVDKESFPTMWPPVAYKRELTQNRLARYIVTYEVGAEAMPEAAPSTGHDSRSGFSRLVSGVKTLFGGKDGRAPEPPSPRQKLVGLAGLWFMVDEAHLTTIAVRGSYRRRGIGELLLISAIDLALERQCRFVTLEVRVSNKGAQALYEKYGFARTGLRRGYYTDNHEDALIMST
ncbi:MAG: ribosomal protein S18-alanine N-acetyltransferase, partial [Dehalococcoidia bacterium]|nr:ribosomal protein S18-alanine N-acetyltransferase [Dehalococcoidia bacterium]